MRRARFLSRVIYLPLTHLYQASIYGWFANYGGGDEKLCISSVECYRDFDFGLG